MDRQEPVSSAHQVPSLSRALRTTRTAALRAPEAWHESDTRRFGIQVAWLVGVAGDESVRIQRDLVRPYSEDLIAVARRLPAPVEVAEVEVLPSERTLILRLRARGTGPRTDSFCGRCERPRHPLQPLFGRDGVCAACATAPGNV